MSAASGKWPRLRLFCRQNAMTRYDEFEFGPVPQSTNVQLTALSSSSLLSTENVSKYRNIKSGKEK
jgi:hypothetical protein